MTMNPASAMCGCSLNRRQASLLLIKIRAGKIRFFIPIFLPLLLYLVEMIGSLKAFVCWNRSGKAYQILSAAEGVRLLLGQLRCEGAFDLVDLEAEEKEHGKVFIKIALW